MLRERAHSQVVIGKETVAKRADPHLMRVEYEKTNAAITIAETTNLFKVPRILEYNEGVGEIVFEKIDGLQPYSKSLDYAATHIQKIARALAFIHQNLQLPSSFHSDIPAQIAFPEDTSYLHGDFNADNVCIQSGTGDLYIIDWQITSRFGRCETYGTRYFDLVWFVNYLLWAPSLRHLLARRIVRHCLIFWSTYLAEAKLQDGFARSRLYAQSFFDFRSEGRSREAPISRRPLLGLSKAMTERFLLGLNSCADPIARNY